MSTKMDEAVKCIDGISYGAYKFDFDVNIRIRYTNDEEKEEEDTVSSHRLVLSSFSPYFRQLMSESTKEGGVSTLELDLSMFPNALNAFKVMIGALYSGEIKLANATANEVLTIVRYCQVTGLESKIMSSNLQFNINNLFPGPKNIPIQNQQPMQYLSNIMQLWSNPFLNVMLQSVVNSNNLAISPSSDDSTASQTQSEGSSPRANSVATPPNSDLEKIVPNDDKEGWCRNKKYIEKVDGGFMCTVCRKVYGRYNSVSYHVTIYHRNPPIRCEENGCNFSTREARYIHFHKYYRHHIPLPENIDLGSRKCPFCRHVSKSPAMLEKHIARHESENNPLNGKKTAHRKKANSTDAQQQNFTANPSSSLMNSTLPTMSTPIKCTLCPFITFGTDVLFMHLATTHASELASLATATSSSESVISNEQDDQEDIEVDVKPNISNLQITTPLQLDTAI